MTGHHLAAPAAKIVQPPGMARFTKPSAAETSTSGRFISRAGAFVPTEELERALGGSVQGRQCVLACARATFWVSRLRNTGQCSVASQSHDSL
mmetsp:Transcript_71813/g.135638  ORF Transcript_71813/g.135638 Transcript_71813/m.135638 type:complete len:93 (+) Transcript_71813:950-1228(+)